MSNAIVPNPNVPQIPQPLAEVGALVYTAQSLKQGMDSLAGNRGNVLDRAVTFNDLVGAGLIAGTGANGIQSNAADSAALTAEAAARVSGDNKLQASLTSETARATAAENVLTNHLTTEEVARAAGDAINAVAISTETTRAKTAEAHLQMEISGIHPSGSITLEDDSGNTIASIGTLQVLGVVASGSSPSGIVNTATIIGAGDGTIANGVPLLFRGGPGGAGSYTAGGNVFANGGYGGYGTSVASGGAVYLKAGAGGPGGVYGPGGYAALMAGGSYGASAGGGVTIGGGSSSLATGGNVYVNNGPGSPAGRLVVDGDPSLIVVSKSWTAGEALDSRTIFTAIRAMVVTAVVGRVDAVNGGAATLVVVKAASGTAPSGGTALTSTSMDLVGTANTNQSLTLSSTLADYTLAAGDSLCLSESGVLTTSAGCITVWAAPQ